MTGHDYGHGGATLSAATARITDARAELSGMAGDLEERIRAGHGQWSGEGARAFFALHQAWTERQRVVLGALDGFAEALRATEADDLATDAAQSAAMSTLTGRLG